MVTMDIDVCPNDSRGRHDYKILAPMGDSGPSGKPVSKYCTKCHKSVDLTENPDEIAFPDLNSSTEDK